MLRNLLIFLALAGVAVYFIARRKRPAKLFEIRVDESDVMVQGPIPNREHETVRKYIHSLRLPVGARISGFPTRRGFEVRFSSSVRTDDRDRVRAFLVDDPTRMLH